MITNSFYHQNTVLHRVGIVKGEGWEFKGDKEFKAGQVDVLDLNSSGAAETYQLKQARPERTAPDEKAVNQELYREPVLSTSLKELKKHAGKEGILTQNDVSDLNIRNGGVIWSGKEGSGWAAGERTVKDSADVLDLNDPSVGLGSPRSIRTLIAELAPFEKNAQWAIDTKKGEFLVYTPNA